MCGSGLDPSRRRRPRTRPGLPPPERTQSRMVAKTVRGKNCRSWYSRSTASRSGVSGTSASGRRGEESTAPKARRDAAAMPKQRPLPYTNSSARRRGGPPPPGLSGTRPTGLRKPKPSRAGSKPCSLDVDGVPVDRHGCLAHHLGEARVGVYGHPDLLRRPLDQLGEDALGYEVGDLRPYHVHPQDEVGLRVGDHLHESVWLALDKGLADRPEGELRLLDLVALFLGLLAGQPERGDLRATEGDARDQVLVQRHWVLAGHVLGGDYALVSGGVGEPVAAYDVAHGVDAVLGGPVELVHLYLAAVVHLDRGGVQVESFDRGLPPDSDQDLLGLQGLALFVARVAGRVGLPAVGALLVALLLLLLLLADGGDLDPHPIVGLLEALRIGHGARHDPDTAVLEGLPELVGDLRLLGRQEQVQDLDY